MESKRPANAGTLYQVASITKYVNSLGILALVKTGKLSLSKDIRTYLKTWAFPDNEFSKGKTITLKDLLILMVKGRPTITSALNYNSNSYLYKITGPPEQPDD